MTGRFWLDDDACAVFEPLLPTNQPGARRVDDRRVLSGILHVLRSGCPWRDCPREYGPPTTIYNRFDRWSRRRTWQRLLAALAAAGRIGESVAIDSSYVRVHRSAAGGKGGAKAQAIGTSRGGRTTKLHLITDLLGRPIVLHLTPGNVADIKAAPVPLAAAGRFKVDCRSGLRRRRSAARLRTDGAQPVIPGGGPASGRSATTSDVTASGGASRPRSVGSRISAAWPPATTSSRPTSCPPSRLRQCTPSGCD